MSKVVQKIDQISNSEVTIGLKNNATVITSTPTELTIDKELSLNNHKLTDLDTPTDATDAVNKNYVDSYNNNNDTEIGNIESSIGLNADGTKTNNTTSYNYIEKTSNENLISSVRALDTQLGTTSSSVENLSNTKASKIPSATTISGNVVVVGSDTVVVGLSTYYDITQSNIPSNKLVITDETQALTNKTIDASLNTISNITTDNVAASNLETAVGEVDPKFASKGYVDANIEKGVKLKNSLDLTANGTEGTAYNMLSIVSPAIGDTYVVTVTGYVANVRIPGGTVFTSITLAAVNDWITYTESGWIILHSSDDKAVWGNISGTLANQTDLSTALGLKADKEIKLLNSIALADASGNLAGSGKSFASDFTVIDDNHIPSTLAVSNAINAASQPGVIQSLYLDFNYSNIASGVISTIQIPANALIRKISLAITTEFTPVVVGTPTLIDVTVGVTNIMSNIYNDSTIAGIYINEDFYNIASASTININFTNNSSTGVGRLYIDYIAIPISAA